MCTTVPDERLSALSDWLSRELGHTAGALRPASSDASFRRYFRLTLPDASFIAMDAPPAHEDVRPFLKAAELLSRAGVNTPAVHAADEDRGFLLLDDFGSASYLDRLSEESVERLYGDALDALARLQTGVDVGAAELPAYDEALLRREMDLFKDWFLERLVGLELTTGEAALLDETWRLLVDSALEQPKVCVHRDYHSRNLMVTESDNPGVLDFQDAVIGPVTYDLVSLLRDCYIAWPRARVDGWALAYHDRMVAEGVLANSAPQRFLRWFDLMGVQRHLKAIGIFARLKLRDGKPGYLGDIPRTMDYVTGASARHPELAGFRDFLLGRVLEPAREALGGHTA
ncbi:aminoglycoside phosphotransferase family protein [Methylococcus sp. EFPC2]|uniref:aminoglycoside phosphotransferase family protein n=1 Tax=Methylococcus sp. EFPC2 TaxID=2812648 RepID=UPI0019682FA1|nr:phosphotransferase [Methylococcus sp. EFPC2]QSA98255.1 phosphotransferase [Methylococcus sp. EFPC2]